MDPLPITEAFHAQDLHDIRETDPIYVRDRIVHAGTIMRCCNWVLTHNVILPAWIHMGSTVRNLGVAHVGDTLNVRARITKNYEHKGHKWVEIDCDGRCQRNHTDRPGVAHRHLSAEAGGRGGVVPPAPPRPMPPRPMPPRRGRASEHASEGWLGHPRLCLV